MKILIVSRHCGEVGSGGSRRPLLIAKALQRAGHIVCVITPFDPPGLDRVLRIRLPITPHSEAQKRNAESEAINNVLKRRNRWSYWRPVQILRERTLSYLRLWKYFPDIDRLWTNQVELALSQGTLFEVGETFDWVFTTSPPESVHRLGPILSHATGARWCLELRDSWIKDSHRNYIKGLRRWAEGLYAKNYLRMADACVTVDANIAAEISTLSGNDTPCKIIGHFSNRYEGIGQPLSETTFNLVHSGGFKLSYNRRNLAEVLRALAPISRYRISRHLKPLCLHVAGRLTTEESTLAQCTVELQVIHYGSLELDKSRALQKHADALLLYAPSESAALPGKYAEYALSGKPIILLGEPDLRKLVHDATLLRDLSDLKDLSPGTPGYIDDSYDVDNAMEMLVTFLASLS